MKRTGSSSKPETRSGQKEIYAVSLGTAAPQMGISSDLACWEMKKKKKDLK